WTGVARVPVDTAVPEAVSLRYQMLPDVLLALFVSEPESMSATAVESETKLEPDGAEAVKFGVSARTGVLQVPMPAVPAAESTTDDPAAVVLSLPVPFSIILPSGLPAVESVIRAPAVTSLTTVMEPPPVSVRLNVPVEAVAPLAKELQLQVMRLTLPELESSINTEPL